MVIQLVFIAQCRVGGWLIGPGWCSPEIDCCWLRLTFRQLVWGSFSESMLLWSYSWYLQHSTVSCLWLVDRPGWCSPEKDYCWLRLTFRHPICGSHLQNQCYYGHTVGIYSTVSCLWLVDRPGWCSPEKDCCWLRLTFR